MFSLRVKVMILLRLTYEEKKIILYVYIWTREVYISISLVEITAIFSKIMKSENLSKNGPKESNESHFCYVEVSIQYMLVRNSI